jgi:uncharacterized protein
VAPRLTYPNRRIDALRGSVAVERGPLVYCFEQADQPGGASVEDLALGPGGLSEQDATLPGVGSTVVVRAEAAILPPVSDNGLPYRGGPDTGAVGVRATAVAVPYFQWDNRDGRAMRVWMPRGRTAEAAAGDGGADSEAEMAAET